MGTGFVMQIEKLLTKDRQSLGQVVRYGAVGLLSNTLLYLLYILITGSGIGHKTTMTLLYIAGTLITFAFNRSWTFKHEGAARKSLPRYVMAYGYGYLANWALLFLFVDVVGYDHRVVQFILIFAIALQLFLIQKFWIFRLQNAA